MSGDNDIKFDTGSVTMEELEAVLNTLPVDITFVDKDDTVRYFNQSGQRIFARAKAVIGRRVQQCHPQKSLDKVTSIVEEFKSGRRDSAEFWIQMKGKVISIRFFPVRDKDGNYLGCLEVVQDITELQKLKGEKRLLD